MGKYRKQRKHHNDGPRNHSSNSSQVSTMNQLESDLGNLDESKRYSGCSLLCDLFLFNLDNQFFLEKLTSKNILSKLNMRLVDFSLRTRIKATYALLCLSQSHDVEIHQRVVNIGIFRTAITLSMEQPNLNIADGEYIENLMLSISNIISTCTSACYELITYKFDFVTYLIESIITASNTNQVSPNPITNRVLFSILNCLVVLASQNTQLSTSIFQLPQYQQIFQIASHQMNHWVALHCQTASLRTEVPDSTFEQLFIIIRMFESMLGVFTTLRCDSSLIKRCGIAMIVRFYSDVLRWLAQNISLDSCSPPGVKEREKGSAVTHSAGVVRDDAEMMVMTVQSDEVDDATTTEVKPKGQSKKSKKHKPIAVQSNPPKGDDRMDNDDSTEGRNKMSSEPLMSRRSKLTFDILQICVNGLKGLLLSSHDRPGGLDESDGFEDEDDTAETTTSSLRLDPKERHSRLMALSHELLTTNTTAPVYGRLDALTTASISVEDSMVQSIDTLIQHMKDHWISTRTHTPSSRFTTQDVEMLECIEGLSSLLQTFIHFLHAVAIAETALASRPVPPPPDNGLVWGMASFGLKTSTVQSAVTLLNFGLDLINHVSKVKDLNNSDSLPFELDNRIDRGKLKESIVSLCTNSMESLYFLLRNAFNLHGLHDPSGNYSESSGSDMDLVAPTLPSTQNQWTFAFIREADSSFVVLISMSQMSLEDRDGLLKAVALAWIRCVALPFLELCVPGMQMMSSGDHILPYLESGTTSLVKYDAVGEPLLKETSPGCVVCCNEKNFLGDRCMIRLPSTVKSYVFYHPTLHALFSNAILNRLMQPVGYFFLPKHPHPTEEHLPIDPSSKIQKGTIQVLDTGLNALIDLNASDDKQYLKNFLKLQANRKMTQHLQDYKIIYQKTFENSSNAKGQEKILSKQEREKCEETMENVENFINYKTSFE